MIYFTVEQVVFILIKQSYFHLMWFYVSLLFTNYTVPLRTILKPYFFLSNCCYCCCIQKVTLMFHTLKHVLSFVKHLDESTDTMHVLTIPASGHFRVPEHIWRRQLWTVRNLIRLHKWGNIKRTKWFSENKHWENFFPLENFSTKFLSDWSLKWVRMSLEFNTKLSQVVSFGSLSSFN